MAVLVVRGSIVGSALRAFHADGGSVPALITLPLHLLVSLAGFILWIIVLIKANQGQMYKLPVIGDIAEKQANAM